MDILQYIPVSCHSYRIGSLKLSMLLYSIYIVQCGVSVFSMCVYYMYAVVKDSTVLLQFELLSVLCLV